MNGANGRTGPVCLLNAESFSDKAPGDVKVDVAVQFAPLFGKWLDSNDVAGNGVNVGIANRMFAIMNCVGWDLLNKPHNPDVQTTVTVYRRLKGLLPDLAAAA